MEKKNNNHFNKKFFVTLLVVTLVFFAVTNIAAKTVSATMLASAEEAAKITHDGEMIQGYDLVIIEDEQLPAAATPEKNHADSAAWVIILTCVVVFLIGYELWYEACLARIKALTITDEDRKIAKSFNRFSPFKAVAARRELESRAAESYFAR